MSDEIERLKNQNNALQEHNRRLVKELQKIVRCKDCQYADFKCPYPTCNLLEMNITEQSFCSWAKMKGDSE